MYLGTALRKQVFLTAKAKCIAMPAGATGIPMGQAGILIIPALKDDVSIFPDFFAKKC